MSISGKIGSLHNYRNSCTRLCLKIVAHLADPAALLGTEMEFDFGNLEYRSSSAFSLRSILDITKKLKVKTEEKH